MGCQETKGQKPRAKILGCFSEAEKLWHMWVPLEMNWNTLVNTTRSGMTFKNISVFSFLTCLVSGRKQALTVLLNKSKQHTEVKVKLLSRVRPHGL